MMRWAPRRRRIATVVLAVVWLALPSSSGETVTACAAADRVASVRTSDALAREWCCCRGCCGYAVDCSRIPGCPSC